MFSAEEAVAYGLQFHKVKYATLSTVSSNGDPWNAPVFCAYDAALNIYWNSGPDAQHSQNIDANGKVFVVFYDSTIPEGTGLGAGLYLRCTASMLTDEPDVRAGRQLIVDRAGDELGDLGEFQAPGPQRVYKAVPTAGWVNDGGEIDGRWVDFRSEVSLDAMRVALSTKR